MHACRVGSAVGAAVGKDDGAPLGSAVGVLDAGDAVGKDDGTAVVGVRFGESVGDGVGSDVVGGMVVGATDVGVVVDGAELGDGLGSWVGVAVGAEDVGTLVSRTQVWPRVVQSPSEHRWVLTQLQRKPGLEATCSQIPYPGESQP